MEEGRGEWTPEQEAQARGIAQWMKHQRGGTEMDEETIRRIVAKELDKRDDVTLKIGMIILAILIGIAIYMTLT